MGITVSSLDKQLTVYTFDDFLASVTKVALPGKQIVLNLSNLEFIDPFAMTGIIYCCADLIEYQDCQVRLDVGGGRACSFLPRVGFFNVLSDQVKLLNTFTLQLDLADALRGNNPALLELTVIDSPEVIDEILDRLIHVLHNQLHYHIHDAYDLAIVFSELCQNVLDHNPVISDGLAAMQVYNGRRGRFMQFVVADRGDGIRKTLQRNQKYAGLNTDIDAIIQSIELGASEYEDPTRGNGLYHLLDLSFKHQGAVHIRSGSGKVYLRMDHRKAKRFDVPFLSGCQFSIAFREQDQKWS